MRLDAVDRRGGTVPRLSFKGKVFVENHHLAVPFHELVPVRDKGLSEKASLHDNLIIHGDNLAALKSLLPTYHGKVKCVYIDPPYNTGKEGWAYNDKVNSPLMQDWLGRVVDRDDLTRHDKWCCMMVPRLKLLREMLSEDGVIFVSIDDNEVHHLRCLMDEVFGEHNRVGQIIWHGSTDNNPTNIATEHEYIVCYAADRQALEEVWKSASFGPKAALERIGAELLEAHPEPEERQREYSRWLKEHKAQVKPLDRYKFIDEGGVFTGSQSVHNPGREGYRYDVIHPVTGRPCKQPLMGYRFPESTMDRLLEEDRVIFGADESKIIELKVYVEDYEAKLGSVIAGIDSRRGANEIREIFPEDPQVFKNPKPSTLIGELLSFATDPDSIVLDSFAGSGTTGHAVLAQNAADGGSRRFILVECEDYADSLTAERMRRVIEGIPDANDDALKAGLGGTFSYFELGRPMRQESLLDGSNLPPWEKLASYVFFTATGQEFDPAETDRETGFVGHTGSHDVFLIYEPDMEKLKSLALSLPVARALPAGSRRKLVFAPTKYLDPEFLHQYRIDFQQLPFQIYEAIERLER